MEIFEELLKTCSIYHKQGHLGVAWSALQAAMAIIATELKEQRKISQETSQKT